MNTTERLMLVAKLFIGALVAALVLIGIASPTLPYVF
jgi:hypothetical protein